MNMSTLVRDIVTDMGDLVKQQLQLTRREIEEDLRKSKEAASIFVLGAASLFLGGIAFCLMLAHLIHWLTEPAGVDQAWVPLWGCHAIVSGLFLALGAALAAVGREKMKSINALRNPATEALKENVQWLTTPK